MERWEKKLIFFAGNCMERWREKNLVDKVRNRLVSYANKKEIEEVCLPVWDNLKKYRGTK